MGPASKRRVSEKSMRYSGGRIKVHTYSFIAAALIVIKRERER